MSSKASGARRVTLTSQPKGAAALTRWSPPRTKPATNGAPGGSGACVGAGRMMLALHRAEDYRQA
jgi:hypothetical protein